MAKKYSLLINEEQLRLFTPISGTFDWAYIAPHVITAQDKDIQPILGFPLYQRLLDGVNDSTLTVDEELLLTDYVQKALAHWTMYYAYPYLPSKLVQSSLSRVETDESTPIDIDEAERLSRQSKSRAEFYTERLISYLEANGALFPEFDTTVSGEIEPSRDGNYSFGFNLDEDEYGEGLYTKGNAAPQKTEWGEIEGDVTNQTDLQTELNKKQDKAPNDDELYVLQNGDLTSLKEGTGVSISPSGIISATAEGSTTAGLLQRYYGTGDLVPLPAGTFSLLQDNKGTVESVTEAITIGNDPGVWYFSNADTINEASVNGGLLPKGNYQGQSSVESTDSTIEWQYKLEIYKTDTDGNVIDSGILSEAVGDLGVRPIGVLTSGQFEIAAGKITQVPMSGSLSENVTIEVGQRVRFHLGARRINSEFGNDTLTFYLGTLHDSYVDAPIPVTSDNVKNNSTVTGQTVTDALDELQNTTAGKVEEAPIDGKQYARQDGAWSEVVGGGGGEVITDVTWQELIDLAGKKSGDRFNVTTVDDNTGIIYNFITLTSSMTFNYTYANGITEIIKIE